jgi:hypothetical protein
VMLFDVITWPFNEPKSSCISAIYLLEFMALLLHK